jgi:HEAT repeat protein
MICGAIMLGGMAIAVVQAVSPSSPSRATASEERGERDSGEPRSTASATKEEQADAPSPLSPQLLRANAVNALRDLLKSNSRRLVRLSAMALARVNDPEALAQLVELFELEESTLSKVDIAFAQARAGVQVGREYLVAQLSASRRDVRIDAARRLVELGDDSGRKALSQMLSVRSHKLGAAALLARLGDEKGIEVLAETLSNASASEENKMRAAVALGRAGGAEGESDSAKQARELLLKILSDGRYVVDAAGALARLGDERAIPALERQLQLTSMRVSAAESLAGLQAKISLEPLAAALLEENDEGRVTAAEAILILTDSEREK